MIVCPVCERPLEEHSPSEVRACKNEFAEKNREELMEECMESYAHEDLPWNHKCLKCGWLNAHKPIGFSR